ncbi:helicase-related protein [Thermodesulfobium sp.]
MEECVSKKLKKDDLISGPYWPESVTLKIVEEEGEFIHIVGATTKSKRYIDQFLTLNELEKIQILDKTSYFKEEAWKVFLAVEALRYRYASLYDPLLAVNISKVEPLPHQIEAVYGYVLKNPRIRFLIADDPGAGKTIMAGLIIKELKLRNLAKRILIVTPGHIKDQWRRELKERFDETFELIDRNRLDNEYKTNIWEKENQVITSVDFAKKDDVIRTLNATRFDLIVVDEAHKMSAYRYAGNIDKSDRYKLGEVLSNITEHLLFLTATPHKGDPENFRLFLDLLEKGFFANNDMVRESVTNKDNPLFIRRIKEDLKDFEGKPLFLPRYVKTIYFNLGESSPNEKELYNELSKYVENQYNLESLSNSTKRRNIAFVLAILQRRLASSTYALLRSLERRKKKLEDSLNFSQDQNNKKSEIYDFEEIEDMSEDERWQKEYEWETFSTAKSKEDLKKEIVTIQSLIKRAKGIIDNEEEIKLKKLKESLVELGKHVKEKNQRKILIFTESRDTLEYLENKIDKWGYKVNTIHGGMNLDDRVNAESVFRNETEVMVATEAAGEGINLQFCNLMINYDIPWNPNRLEQRMGRIHRYGQTREVFVHNLVANDTREGKVLETLFNKIEEIRNALGSDKVFDVLGEIIDSKQFSKAIIDAAVNARNIDDILKDIEIRVDEEYLIKIRENLGETLATRYIDYTRIKELAQKAKENRLIPEYTQNFFVKAFEKAGGKIREIKAPEIISIESVPYSIKRFSYDEKFKKTYGGVLSRYPKVVFDKEYLKKYPTAEFLTFGHPLFEATLNWVEKECENSIKTGGTFYDPDGKLDGFIVFYEGEIRDGTGAIAGKRLFSFFVNNEGSKIIASSILWDLIEENKQSEESTVDIEEIKNKTKQLAIETLSQYKKELLEERKRQAEIKQKYGVKSLDYFISKLDGELIELEDRKASGENVDLAIRNKAERKSEYEESLKELKKLIEQEQSLTITMPSFLGIIRVKPIRTRDQDMVSDEKIEKIGMLLTMEYERNNQREPEDVSDQNLGFDIRSKDKDGNLRYIEVKARAEDGDIALTQNEWFIAKRFGDDYYLYVIFNASTSPELKIIQNPAKNLIPQTKIEQVRYIIDKFQITEKGAKM